MEFLMYIFIFIMFIINTVLEIIMFLAGLVLMIILLPVSIIASICRR